MHRRGRIKVFAWTYFNEREKDVVDGVLTVSGFNFAGTGQNSGLVFVKLEDWSERKKDSQSVTALAARASAYFASIKEAMIIAVPPRAVLELGSATASAEARTRAAENSYRLSDMRYRGGVDSYRASH